MQFGEKSFLLLLLLFPPPNSAPFQTDTRTHNDQKQASKQGAKQATREHQTQLNSTTWPISWRSSAGPAWPAQLYCHWLLTDNNTTDKQIKVGLFDTYKLSHQMPNVGAQQIDRRLCTIDFFESNKTKHYDFERPVLYWLLRRHHHHRCRRRRCTTILYHTQQSPEMYTQTHTQQRMRMAKNEHERVSISLDNQRMQTQSS